MAYGSLRLSRNALVSFCLVILLACFASPGYSAVSGEITFYVNRVDLVSNGSYARWVKEFQALYPQARVRVEGIADYEANMPKRFQARDFGDVMLVPRDMPKQTFSKYFVPLNDLKLSDRIYFAQNWEYEGQQYAYTQGVIAEGLVYNKAMFNAVGITELPKTRSEFFALAEKIKSRKLVPIALNVGAAWPLQQWDKSVMAIAGKGDYFASMVDDSQPFSAGKPYAESLRIAHRIFSSGYSEPDFITNNWEASKQQFIKNKVAMFYLGNWVIPQLIEAGMRASDIGFIPFPLDDTGNSKALLNFDWAMAVSRYSKNPETAKAWIDFIITKSNFADVAGFIPTDKSRLSSLPQLAEYMSFKPQMIPVAPESNDFIRLANKAGMDFMGGNYIRNILLSPDFDGSMAYWNKRWQQAKANF